VKDEKTQPTPISKEEYARFKQWVQDVHGTTRGHLSTEIENALREYRQDDNEHDKLSRIEDDVATLKAMVAEAEADGGSVAHSSESDNTRTRAEGEKPKPNAPRTEKIDWFIQEHGYDPSGGEVHEAALEKLITNKFGFGERTVEKYVEQSLGELNAKQHPDVEGKYVWGDKIQQVREEETERAKEELDRVVE